MCTRGQRRTGVTATVALRDEWSVRMVVWSPPSAAAGPRPIGTFAIQWRASSASEAVLGEMSLPSTSIEAELWQAI